MTAAALTLLLAGCSNEDKWGFGDLPPFAAICERPATEVGRILAEFIEQDFPHERGTYKRFQSKLTNNGTERQLLANQCAGNEKYLCAQVVECQVRTPLTRKFFTYEIRNYTLNYRVESGDIIPLELNTLSSFGTRSLIFDNRSSLNR